MNAESEGQFELVGYRFRKILVDDGPIEGVQAPIKLDVVIGTKQPELAATTKGGRPVVEVTLVIHVTLEGNEPRNLLKPVVQAVCTAGFQARETRNDGNIGIFDLEYSAYTRSIYWLVRQRLSSMLTSTSLKTFSLPFDINSSDVDRVGANPELAPLLKELAKNASSDTSIKSVSAKKQRRKKVE